MADGRVPLARQRGAGPGLVAAASVVATCGVALAVTACSAASPDGAATTKRSPSPSATAAASPSRDPRAQQICDDLHSNILDADAQAFGAELGKKVAGHAAGDRAAEAQAQQGAVGRINDIVGRLRTHAGEATEPRLKAALTASAANLEIIAADTPALSGLASLDQVSGVTGRFSTALAPISDYCTA